jgi:hypothetical protein
MSLRNRVPFIILRNEINSKTKVISESQCQLQRYIYSLAYLITYLEALEPSLGTFISLSKMNNRPDAATFITALSMKDFIGTKLEREGGGVIVLPLTSLGLAPSVLYKGSTWTYWLHLN